MLTGTVTGGDGKPLEGAQVLLVGTTRSARADYKGNFRMTGLPAGTQKVEVRLLSYQLKSYVVNLSAVNEAHLTAVLDTRAQVLDPVITTAKETSDIPGFDQRKAAGIRDVLHEEADRCSCRPRRSPTSSGRWPG